MMFRRSSEYYMWFVILCYVYIALLQYSHLDYNLASDMFIYHTVF